MNVYQVGVQYLGAGVISFAVETAPQDNSPTFTTCHALLLPNTLTTTSFANPSFQFTMEAKSTGSTSNVAVKVGSFAGFVEGYKRLRDNEFSYVNSRTDVGDVNYRPLFTIRNTRYFGGKANQAILSVVSIAAAVKHQSPVTIYLIRNATLSAGTPDFIQYSSNSISYIDTSATQCIFATNDQLVWSGSLGETGNMNFTFVDDITIEPGETITVAAKTTFQTASWTLASLNTIEDK